MQIIRMTICVIALCTQSACTTLVMGEGETRDIVSLGVTRIKVPERSGDLIAFRRTGLGIGLSNTVGDQAWLGFQSSDWIMADPAKCQMLVVIRSNAEANQAQKILETLKGEDVCYVNDTQR